MEGRESEGAECGGAEAAERWSPAAAVSRRAGARPSVRARDQPPSGAGGDGHLGGLALPTSPRGVATAKREQERRGSSAASAPSPGRRLLRQRLLPPPDPSLAKPPPRRSHTSL